MRGRFILTVFLFLLLAGGGAAGWGWGCQEHSKRQEADAARGRLEAQLEANRKDADFIHRRVDFLKEENDRLSGLLTGKQHEEEFAFARNQRIEIERQVTGLRDLSFLHRVRYREIPRADLPAVLRQKLAQQVPDQEFSDTGVALSALGLLPAGIDLKKTYLDLLGEQIGAFYDQHTQELVTFSGQSLANAQNRVILAHELTHALEDQHFNLSQLPIEAKGNDDRALAASALVEGDATLVMNRYMIGNMSGDVLRDSLASALTTDVRQLAAAPRYLREMLLFPYLRGQEFCQALYAHGGWNALADAFRHPPASTAEILHPERFLANPREKPVAIAFVDTAILGQKPIDDNVIGEFGLRCLLGNWFKDDKKAASTAAEWRGDRFAVYGNAKAYSYVWIIAWNGADTAERFALEADTSLSSRYAPRGAASTHTQGLGFGSGGSEGKKAGGFASRAGGRYVLAASRDDSRETVIIDAQDKVWADALSKRFGEGFGLPDSAAALP